MPCSSRKFDVLEFFDGLECSGYVFFYELEGRYMIFKSYNHLSYIYNLL